MRKLGNESFDLGEVPITGKNIMPAKPISLYSSIGCAQIINFRRQRAWIDSLIFNSCLDNQARHWGTVRCTSQSVYHCVKSLDSVWAVKTSRHLWRVKPRNHNKVALISSLRSPPFMPSPSTKYGQAPWRPGVRGVVFRRGTPCRRQSPLSGPYTVCRVIRLSYEGPKNHLVRSGIWASDSHSPEQLPILIDDWRSSTSTNSPSIRYTYSYRGCWFWDAKNNSYTSTAPRCAAWLIDSVSGKW